MACDKLTRPLVTCSGFGKVCNAYQSRTWAPRGWAPSWEVAAQPHVCNVWYRIVYRTPGIRSTYCPLSVAGRLEQLQGRSMQQGPGQLEPKRKMRLLISLPPSNFHTCLHFLFAFTSAMADGERTLSCVALKSALSELILSSIGMKASCSFVTF